MHYQIFLPGPQGAGNQKLLDQVGLGDLAERAEFHPTSQPGPGTLVYWVPAGQQARFGYQPDRQTWTPAIPRGELPADRYQVGIWTDDPPLPADLLRDETFPGSHVTLGDGRSWLIPEAGQLPRGWRRDRTGAWYCIVQDRFREFWDLSELFYSQLTAWDPEDNQLTVDERFPNYAELALSLNYRYVPELADQLALFTSDNLIQVALATISAELIRQVAEEKKNRAAAGTPAG